MALQKKNYQNRTRVDFFKNVVLYKIYSKKLH